MTERFCPRAASYVVFRRDHQICLMRRFQTGWQDGNYTLPSGHIDLGETASQCAIRECLEEVGVTVVPQDLHFFHVLHRKSETGNVYVDFYFCVDIWKGDLRNNEPHKCDDVQWFSLHQLPDNMIPFLRDILTEGFEKQKYFSEKGW